MPTVTYWQAPCVGTVTKVYNNSDSCLDGVYLTNIVRPSEPKWK